MWCVLCGETAHKEVTRVLREERSGTGEVAEQMKADAAAGGRSKILSRDAGRDEARRRRTTTGRQHAGKAEVERVC